MRVVQITPPWFTVPPHGYGGIERVVFDLVESLTAEGCEVILCAPEGSQTHARLIPNVPKPLGLDMTEAEKSHLFAQASRNAYRIARDTGADLIHDHTDFIPPRGYPIPIVRTIHGPATPAALQNAHRMSRHGDALVAISHRQREIFERKARERWDDSHALHFVDVIHNPIDVAAAPFYPASEKRGYVAFLGRAHWEKSPDSAIRVAQAAGVPLMMALRVTTEEQSYFEAVVEPLEHSIKNLAKYVGEVSGHEKDELLGRASAVLFPSPWEEPFGLVLIEAGARGTPVIALARGAAPEIIVDGVTGILCADEEEMIAAVPKAMTLDPEACRAHVAAHFDRPIIAKQYLRLYESVLAG
ncbi:MAG TPA: glycosyltransferase family 4 protein [Thermomicrobiales bacterium]|nr:glycosyltransferase family 4 protein [Thermomicrobiales bacterium]